MKIVIDAGHGPETPGKRCPDDSMREYHFNTAVAKHIDFLLMQYEEVETLLTHEDDYDVPLKERTSMANVWEADVFVSIHANASGNDWSDAKGIETYTYTTRPPKAVGLAVMIQRKLIQVTGLYDRGVKAADFHVLRETNMTAILIECGFMTNRTEAELLKSDAYRRKCAEAIVQGLVECYGLKPKQTNERPEWEIEFIKAKEWAIEQKITDGSRPKDNITREEIWTMLYRMKGGNEYVEKKAIE